MRTDDEICEELSEMSLPQLHDRCCVLLTRIGAINSDTGKPPTSDELAIAFAEKYRKQTD
jgi:hypothetical protein